MGGNARYEVAKRSRWYCWWVEATMSRCAARLLPALLWVSYYPFQQTTAGAQRRYYWSVPHPSG